MAEIYKFFNSAPGDPREYYASDFANYFSSVLSAGLLLDENEEYGLQVTHESGLQTVVSPGKALIKGYSYENTTPLTLTHDLPEMTFDRIDRIVLRLDLRNQHRYIRLFVKAGEASENPEPPELQRDEFIYELSLAQVRLRANTASIDPADITDERALEDVCGIAQSLITVPTSVFQQQFNVWFENRKQIYGDEMENWKNQQQADFENWKQQEQADFVAWVQSLREVLDENAAGNLLNLINQNANEITQVKQQITSVEDEIAAHQAESTQNAHLAKNIGLEDTEGNFTATEVEGAMQELFTNVSNGKQLIGGAITDVDDSVVIPADPTFQQLADSIRQISTGFDLVAGNDVIIYLREKDVKRTNSISYVTVRSFTFSKSGSIRVTYNYRVTVSSTNPSTFRIMLFDDQENGQQVDSVVSGNTNYRERVVDIVINEGDRIELQIAHAHSGYAESDFFSISIQYEDLPFIDNLGGD